MHVINKPKVNKEQISQGTCCLSTWSTKKWSKHGPS